MPTINQDFWPSHTYVAHDQTFGTDIDKMNLTLPGAGNSSLTTIADFGTSGVKDITFDPNNTRTTTGIDNAFGWAINELDMDSTATAKRRILPGTWSVTFEVAATPVAALSGVTMNARVYRVGASPGFTRTQIGSGTIAMGLISTSRGSFTLNITSMPEIILEADETIQLTMYATGTGQLGGLGCILAIGDGAAGVGPLDFTLRLPAAIATRQLRSHAVAAVSTAVFGNKKVFKNFTVAATNAVAFSKKMFKAFTVAATNGTTVKKLSFKTFTVAGTADAVISKMKKFALSVAGTGGVAFAKLISKNFTVAGTSAVVFVKLPKKILTVAATSGTTLQRKIYRALTVAGTGNAVMQGKKVFKAFAVAGTSAVAFSKLIPKAFTVAATSGVTLSKRMYKNFAVAATPGITFLKLTQKFFTVANTGTANLSILRSKSFAVAGNGAVTLSKMMIKNFTVAGAGGVRMLVQISQSILNRMTAGTGGTTIIKKIFNIFD